MSYCVGAQTYLLRTVILFCALLIFSISADRGKADEASVPEYQLKSVFLLNFAKYVDWPSEAFNTSEAPIVIGVLGENKFGTNLENTVKNKNVGGRKIIIRAILQDSDWQTCHILFISASEKKRLNEILEQVRASPVLTVSEIDQFTEQGGIIRFLKKEQKIRLEIDLQHARKAKLQISSKLLSVADSVKGKQ